MRIDLFPERLDESHHPGAQGLVVCSSGHQLADRLGCQTAHVPQQLTLAEEVEPQHLRDGEHPLGVADVLDHLVRKKRSQLGAPLGSTRRAQPSLLARKCQQELLGTLATPNAGEAVGSDILRLLSRSADDLVKEVGLTAASR